MLQKRLTAKITVITAVLSLGMSAMAVAGVSAPTNPVSGPCGPYPMTCLPEEPLPTPDPCFDNPDPIYYEENCIDESPVPPPGDGWKPRTDDPTDYTSTPDAACPDFEVCDGSTPPRPGAEISRPS